MNRHRTRRPFVGDLRARRVRPTRAAGPSSRTDRRPAVPTADHAALAFLSEILVGDREWTMAEVERLVAMRESAQHGHWRPGPEDDGVGTP